MDISFNTEGSSNSGAQQTSLTLTIPAGVLDGDVMLLAVNAFTPVFTLTPTIASTGTTFTQIGSTEFSNNNSGFVVSGSIWYAVASATDAGKVITASGGNCFWALTVAAYTGASITSPIDVNDGAAATDNTTDDIACPSLTTGEDGDWAVYLCPWGINGMSASPALSGATQRANQNGSGVGTAVWDSNGSVGAAGTSIGGGDITATGSIYWWTAFTVGLAPLSAPAGPGVTFTSTDGDNVSTYSVTWPGNGGSAVDMRVLEPTAPNTVFPHSFLWMLPVESGQGTTNGDSIGTALSLNAHNVYNLTIIQPGYAIDPWYADNPGDSSTLQETFTLDLVTWAEANLEVSGTEKHYLVGFSKSGLGGQGLIFRNPTTFFKCASWDAPFMMTDYDGTDPTNGSTVGGNSADVYGTSGNFTSNYELDTGNLTAWKGASNFGTVNRVWLGGFAVFEDDVNAYDSELTSVGIQHTFTYMVSDTHAWETDWVGAALAWMFPFPGLLMSCFP